MSKMNRSYYEAPIDEFLTQPDAIVLGCLSRNNQFALDLSQRNAWVEEIEVLRKNLHGVSGYLLLEYSIPRMGKRVDAILLLPNVIIAVEFKVGDTKYAPHAIEQVFDYALDLKNFHEQSHDKIVVPILVATEAPDCPINIRRDQDNLVHPLFANKDNLQTLLQYIISSHCGPDIDCEAWLESIYRPTPTIVEAAQVLYQGHNVQEISRSESGATNLTKTAEAIVDIIKTSKKLSTKSICFITGVPGAGKTLAGLNIANSWHDPDNDEHAVFLSGNGPLVDVLREALARDDVANAKKRGDISKKSTALSKVKSFIQNIHHFRDDALANSEPPVEHVAIFDEAQRAWDLEQTTSFMKAKKGLSKFNKSEPDFLISVMDRHKDWATIICLIGGGQEIHTGEAGLREWFRVLGDSYPDWSVYISNKLVDSEYTNILTREVLDSIEPLVEHSDLHLSTSIRSYRSEEVSSFIKALLDCDVELAKNLFNKVSKTFPVVLTRDVKVAKRWLREKARGSERFGVIASSEAQRLKPFGIFVKSDIDPRIWFLNGKEDIRSSYCLEEVATEFQIQGLELDWTCVAWDADLRYKDGEWDFFRFHGTNWQSIHKDDKKRYLKNAYRVLLTRARQGMVIFLPVGSEDDYTRCHHFYDETYNYLKEIGIPEVN